MLVVQCTVLLYTVDVAIEFAEVTSCLGVCQAN